MLLNSEANNLVNSKENNELKRTLKSMIGTDKSL